MSLTRKQFDEQVWPAITEHIEFPEESKTREMAWLFIEQLELFSRKQHDYSSLNILIGGEEGIFVRLADKFSRLVSHFRQGRELKCENVEDTWADIAIYCTMARLLRAGKWQATEGELQAWGIKQKEAE